MIWSHEGNANNILINVAPDGTVVVSAIDQGVSTIVDNAGETTNVDACVNHAHTIHTYLDWYCGRAWVGYSRICLFQWGDGRGSLGGGPMDLAPCRSLRSPPALPFSCAPLLPLSGCSLPPSICAGNR